MSDNVKKEVFEWIKTIAIAGTMALLITMFIRPTLVRGLSMFPTLEENDYLLIYRQAYRQELPEQGNVIVFKSHLLQTNGKEKDLVKRVIGIPGDHVVVAEGEVYINDEKLVEPYINGDYTDGYVDEIIPEGYIFAMGDNRPNSLDSREPSVGLIPLDKIIGKVFIRLYPFNKIIMF